MKTALAVREKTKNTLGIALPKDKRTESLDPLEVAGMDTSNIVQKDDGTLVCMIQSGDTLKGISATLGYSVNELANVNYIYANSALRVPKGN